MSSTPNFSKVNFLVLVLFLTFSSLRSQIDSVLSDTSIISDDLLSEVENVDIGNTALLPSKMIITQRILWANKGLMRNIDYFELTSEKRQRELNLRRKMLGMHQILGFVTLGGMVAQGFVGASLYSGNSGIKDIHSALGVGVNVCYYTTAGLSLFAPPKMINDNKGYSSIKVHKYLGILHLTTMTATNILAGLLESNAGLRPYHRAAAYTAFGSFALSMIIIKF